MKKLEDLKSMELDSIKDSMTRDFEVERSRWIQHKRAFMVEAEELRADIVALKRDIKNMKEHESVLRGELDNAESVEKDLKQQLEIRVAEAAESTKAEAQSKYEESLKESLR